MNELTDIHRALGRIEGQLGEIAKSIKSREDDHEELEERTRTLETAQAHAAGRQSVISAAVSTVVAGVVAWTAKHFA